MKLNRQSITDGRSQWLEQGFILPDFDLETVRRNTIEAPNWIHFGAGNIFRAFPAASLQNLLNQGAAEKGVIAVSGFGAESIDRTYTPYDDLSILVTMKADGTLEKTVVASVMKSLVLDRSREDDFKWLEEAFRKDSLQMVSVTITEKGYKLQDGSGETLPEVQKDLEEGPAASTSYMGKLTALCYQRFLAGEKPLALVSMDNFSHNGDKLKAAVLAFAEGWEERGLAEEGFAAYLCDEQKVAFPWSMIDKITPGPSEAAEAALKEAGVEGAERLRTSRGSWIAAYTNAEEPQYLIIEDAFPNGRPVLEERGILFTDRNTVDLVERMKVCTCLNPLHTALAVFGCLLGYTRIAEEMKDPLLSDMVRKLGYEEGMPVVSDPGILNPQDFLAEVIEERLTNPFLPDMPQRIAMDTSQKLPIRFGETLKAYLADPSKDVSSLTVIPLVFAGWCRYLLAVDDQGRPFEVSPDPMYEALKEHVAGLALGQCQTGEALRPILENSRIFGVNLYDAGLAEKVLGYFCEMMEGPGAVRKTLEKYILMSEKGGEF